MERLGAALAAASGKMARAQVCERRIILLTSASLPNLRALCRSTFLSLCGCHSPGKLVGQFLWDSSARSHAGAGGAAFRKGMRVDKRLIANAFRMRITERLIKAARRKAPAIQRGHIFAS
jgi:hypothetical protein